MGAHALCFKQRSTYSIRKKSVKVNKNALIREKKFLKAGKNNETSKTDNARKAQLQQKTVRKKQFFFGVRNGRNDLFGLSEMR